MLGKLRNTRNLAPLLPFVRLFYGQESLFYWEDGRGTLRAVPQGEGGEQGDPLMPALFALGIHEAVEEVSTQLHPGERIFAFLDDIYLVAPRHRAAEVYKLMARTLEQRAGIKADIGKAAAWSKNGGPPPPGVNDLGDPSKPPVWKGNLPPAENGIVILGTPLGTPEFCTQHAQERIKEENKFLQWLPQIPELQAGWLLLLFCAVPRANHLLRVLPPSITEGYARAHDEGIFRTFVQLVRT